MTDARDLAAIQLVKPGDGAELHLTLVPADGSLVCVLLSAAEAVALAAELLQAARARMGRQRLGPGAETISAMN
jgi:hypothetical protein